MNPNLEKKKSPTSPKSRYARNNQVDHINSRCDEDSTKVEEVETVASFAVDMENRYAVKGDDSDGRVDWTVKQTFATVCLSGLYVGSQIPAFFVGGSLTFIAEDLSGGDAASWIPIVYSLALSSTAPFCGYLQDIFGRRNITIGGGLLLVVGLALLVSASNFSQAITGMVIGGAGAAIGELTAIAGTAELVPVNKRGLYLGLVTSLIIPFTPYLLYSELLATYHTWRWGIGVCLIWNGIWLIGVLLFYFPKSQTRAHGKSMKDILKTIDYLGGLLSISGVILFLVGLQAGGSSNPWSSAYVLCTVLIGLSLLVTFVWWEWKGASNPMIPHEMFAGQTIVGTAFGVAFVAGMNFYALLNFFPLTFNSVFNPNPIQVGLKGLATALTLTLGMVLGNALLSFLKEYNREILLFATIIMTTFTGAFVAVTPDTPGLAVAFGALASFGVGGVVVPAAAVALAVTPDSSITTCVALSVSIRSIGGSIGYAIFYNIFLSKLTPRLPAYIGEYAVQAGLPVRDITLFVDTFINAPKNITRIPGITQEVIQAATIGSRWAYAESLKYIWLTSIGFGVCAIIACLFLGNVSKYMTNRIAGQVRR